ncbi:hypothetical protein NDU88_004853 [Pleurodeles waltl]|uniref:Uncharacterized protein n=1 Tax=Pleurodeles waltl TaxID=8319 RepID=A0AAV7NNI4_PLEWA|nr:hypothetical protein NDU88_004853 [Pleurodeles waltl]
MSSGFTHRDSEHYALNTILNVQKIINKNNYISTMIRNDPKIQNSPLPQASALHGGGRRKAGGTPTAGLLLGWTDADVAANSGGGRGTKARKQGRTGGPHSTPAKAPVERHCTRTFVGSRPALLSVTATVNHPAQLTSNVYSVGSISVMIEVNLLWVDLHSCRSGDVQAFSPL